MPHAGLPSPFWLALSLVLALCISSPSPVHAQTESAPSANPPPQLSLTQQIENLQSKEQLLVQRLIERSSQVNDLEESLRKAKQKSDDSAASSEELEKKLALAKELQYSSEMGLQATLSSLDQSKQIQQRLDSAFQGYRAEMQGQVKQLQSERDGWKVAAIVAALAAAGLGIWAAVK